MSLHRFLTHTLSPHRIALILWILVLIPAFVAIRLPVREDRISKEWAEYNANMKPRSTMIHGWWAQYGFSAYEMGKFDLRVTLRFWADKHIKFIFVPFSPGMESAYEEWARFSGLEKDFGYVYGIDFVVLPFVPGEEIAFAAIANNLKGTVSTDNRGTPINQIPLLANINTLNDIDYAYFTCMAGLVGAFIRQWGTAFPNRPNGLMTGDYREVAQWYGTIVKAATDDMTTAYWQQRYTKDVGEAIIKLDQRNLGSIFFLILFVAALFDFQRSRRLKPEVTVKED